MRRRFPLIAFALLALVLIPASFLLPRHILHRQLTNWLTASGATSVQAEVSAAGLSRATIDALNVEWDALRMTGQDMRVKYRLFGGPGATPLRHLVVPELSLEQQLTTVHDGAPRGATPALEAATGAVIGLLFAAEDAIQVERGTYRLLGEGIEPLAYEFTFDALNAGSERSFRAEAGNAFSTIDASGSLKRDVATLTLMASVTAPMDNLRDHLAAPLAALARDPRWPAWLPPDWPHGLVSLASLDLDVSVEGPVTALETSAKWAIVVETTGLRWAPDPDTDLRVAETVVALRFDPAAGSALQVGANIESLRWRDWTTGEFSIDGRMKDNVLSVGALPFVLTHRGSGLEVTVRDLASHTFWAMNGAWPTQLTRANGAAEVSATWANVLATPVLPVRFEARPAWLELEFPSFRLRDGDPAWSIIATIDATSANPARGTNPESLSLDGASFTFQFKALSGAGGPAARVHGKFSRTGRSLLSPLQFTGTVHESNAAAVALLAPELGAALEGTFTGRVHLAAGLTGLRAQLIDLAPETATRATIDLAYLRDTAGRRVRALDGAGTTTGARPAIARAVAYADGRIEVWTADQAAGAAAAIVVE